MQSDEGFIWRITGVPGIGKSTLLRHFAECCEQDERASIFLDIEGYQAGFGLDVLSDLSKSARFFDADNSNKTMREKMGERFEQYKGGLGSVLEVGKLVDPSGGLIAGGAKVLLDLSDGLAGTAANMSEEAAAAHPELFLLEALAKAATGNNKPICFVDTFEHAVAGNIKLKSRLDFGFSDPRESTLKNQPLARWLSSLFEFLKNNGWLVVIAGRNMPDANVKDQLTRFTRDEMSQAAMQRSKLDPYMPDQGDEVISVLATLSFEGNPLWLQVAMNLLEDLLERGEKLKALSGKPDYLHECFEEEDPFDMGGGDFGIESGRCKLQLLGTLTHHIEGLEGQAWKIALPRILDKGIVSQLFNQDQAQAVLRNFNIAGVFRRKGSTFILHEEIRDLLLAYARSKEWIDTVETRAIHDKIWLFLNNLHLKRLPIKLREEVSQKSLKGVDGKGFADLEIKVEECIPLSWMKEACYHRILSFESFADSNITPKDFLQALAGSAVLGELHKWYIAQTLHIRSGSYVSDLMLIFQEELTQWQKVFGEETVNSLWKNENTNILPLLTNFSKDIIQSYGKGAAVAILSLTADKGSGFSLRDKDFWRKRVSDCGLTGDYTGLLDAEDITEEEIIKVVDSMLLIYAESTNPRDKERCAKALFKKGSILKERHDNDGCLQSYYELVRLYADSDQQDIQLRCSRALLSIGEILTTNNLDLQGGLEAYDRLVSLYGKSEHPDLEVICLAGMISKGIMLISQLSNPGEALSTFDIAFKRYQKAPGITIKLFCSKLLHLKAEILKDNFSDTSGSLSIYDQIIQNYNGYNEDSLKKECSRAYLGKALIQTLDKPAAAIKTYNKLLRRYTKSNLPAVKLNCGLARAGKFAIFRYNDYHESKVLKSCNELLDHHGESDEAAIQTACQLALKYKTDSLAAGRE